MLINSLGQQFGLLSGGCLESNIRLRAQNVMHTGIPLIVRYDMREEEEIAYELGIGCGGMVEIQLNLVNADNQYMGLESLYFHLQERVTSWYWLSIAKATPETAPLCQDSWHPLKLV